MGKDSTLTISRTEALERFDNLMENHFEFGNVTWRATVEEICGEMMMLRRSVVR